MVISRAVQVELSIDIAPAMAEGSSRGGRGEVALEAIDAAPRAAPFCRRSHRPTGRRTRRRLSGNRHGLARFRRAGPARGLGRRAHLLLSHRRRAARHPGPLSGWGIGPRAYLSFETDLMSGTAIVRDGSGNSNPGSQIRGARKAGRAARAPGTPPTLRRTHPRARTRKPAIRGARWRPGHRAPSRGERARAPHLPDPRWTAPRARRPGNAFLGAGNRVRRPRPAGRVLPRDARRALVPCDLCAACRAQHRRPRAVPIRTPPTRRPRAGHGARLPRRPLPVAPARRAVGRDIPGLVYLSRGLLSRHAERRFAPAVGTVRHLPV